MEGLEIINKTHEYLDYIEQHLTNVAISWDVVKTKCSDMDFISNKSICDKLVADIRNHDLSKFGDEEFTMYRKMFFPTEYESENNSADIKLFFQSEAWPHHIFSNSHHYENWIVNYYNKDNDNWKVPCVHMIVDWTAMGIVRNDTAEEYFNKIKDKVNFPDDVVEFMMEIFKRLRKEINE